MGNEYQKVMGLCTVIRSDRRSENLAQKLIPPDRRSEKYVKIETFRSAIWARAVPSLHTRTSRLKYITNVTSVHLIYLSTIYVV